MLTKRNKAKRPLGRKIVDRTVCSILPALSWILLGATLILEKGSRERMGIYRDMVFRNRVIDSTIFTAELLGFYRMALLVIIFVILLLWVASFNSRRPIIRQALQVCAACANWLSIIRGRTRFRYLSGSFISSAALYVMLAYYPQAEWLGYPLICLSMMLVVLLQLFRVAYQLIFEYLKR